MAQAGQHPSRLHRGAHRLRPPSPQPHPTSLTSEHILIPLTQPYVTPARNDMPHPSAPEPQDRKLGVAKVPTRLVIGQTPQKLPMAHEVAGLELSPAELHSRLAFSSSAASPRGARERDRAVGLRPPSRICSSPEAEKAEVRGVAEHAASRQRPPYPRPGLWKQALGQNARRPEAVAFPTRLAPRPPVDGRRSVFPQRPAEPQEKNDAVQRIRSPTKPCAATERPAAALRQLPGFRVRQHQPAELTPDLTTMERVQLEVGAPCDTAGR
jgi:hypothetical protein